VEDLGSVDLIFRAGEFYLHIAVNTDAPEVPEPSGSLNVDLDCEASCLHVGQYFSHGERLFATRSECFKLRRSSLQAIGSRTAKRVLRRVSGREHRFVTDANHCISKSIVAHAKAIRLVPLCLKI
jgi:putative transposase